LTCGGMHVKGFRKIRFAPAAHTASGRFFWATTRPAQYTQPSAATAAVGAGEYTEATMPRNPHALIAKQAPAKAIPDPRHAKRKKAQRKRDALQGERDASQ